MGDTTNQYQKITKIYLWNDKHDQVIITKEGDHKIEAQELVSIDGQTNYNVVNHSHKTLNEVTNWYSKFGFSAGRRD